MTVDFFAAQPHYLDHLLPVYRAMPDEHRGHLYVSPKLKTRPDEAVVPPKIDPNPERLVVVAGFRDLRRTGGRRAVLMEHGAGQTYIGQDPSYAGGVGRHNVALFLCPNEQCAAANRESNPQAQVEVIGCPKLAELDRIPYIGDGATVAFGWHADYTICPESRSAWSHMSPGMKSVVADGRWNVLGHGHPLMLPGIRKVYQSLGIEVVEDFTEVVARADVYAIDNSSTMFEFAYTGRPVVVMNAPWYRRDANHGLRFWDCADVGVHADHPGELVQAIATAFEDRPEQRQARAAAVGRVYPNVGSPTEVAVRAIIDASTNTDLLSRIPARGSSKRWAFPGGAW